MSWQSNEIMRRRNQHFAEQERQDKEAIRREKIHELWQRFKKSNNELPTELRMETHIERTFETIRGLKRDSFDTCDEIRYVHEEGKIDCSSRGNNYDYGYNLDNRFYYINKAPMFGQSFFYKIEDNMIDQVIEITIRNLCTRLDLVDSFPNQQKIEKSTKELTNGCMVLMCSIFLFVIGLIVVLNVL